MNSHEVLNQRADRGGKRSPAEVWANAQHTGAEVASERSSRSVLLFRVAVLAWIIGIAAVGLIQPDSTNPDRTASTPAASTDIEPLESDEPLPAPLLVEGGTLRRDLGGVTRPFDPDFDGDDILDEIFPSTQPPDLSEHSEETVTSTIIFAEPEDPFEGVILAIELLDGGGFKPWAANLDGAPMTNLTQHLEQTNDSWSLAEESGLVEVARFEDDLFGSVKFGWQFDFLLAGSDEVTIQAEPTDQRTDVGVWLWVARLANQDGVNATITPVQVLGADGYVIDVDDRPGDDGVVWTSDDFVYRMTASRLDDNTYSGRDSTEDIDRLRVASRQEWVDAIAASTRTSPTEWVVGAIGLATLAALLFSTVFFLFKLSFRPAVLSAGALASSLFFGTSPTHLGTVALIGLPLGLAWWLHQDTQNVAPNAAPAK